MRRNDYSLLIRRRRSNFFCLLFFQPWRFELVYFIFRMEIIIAELLVSILARFSRVAISASEKRARGYAQLRAASR